jgi:hypothetical protein
MKSNHLFLIFILYSFQTAAQVTNVREHFALGYGYRKHSSAITLGYNGTFIFGEKQIIHAGFGVRMTSFNEQSRDFQGISKNRSGVIINPTQNVNINALNVPIYLELHSKYFLLGGNIDIFGFSVGKKISSLTISGIKKPDSLFIKPTFLNILGRGTNNSEVYIGLKPNRDLTIRLGISLLYAEYHAQYRLSKKNYDYGRYFHDAMMPFFSIVYNADR